MNLTIDPNLYDPDHFYAKLMNIHRDLTMEQSTNLNARLILLLANHIGDEKVLDQAIKIASELED